VSAAKMGVESEEHNSDNEISVSIIMALLLSIMEQMLIFLPALTWPFSFLTLVFRVPSLANIGNFNEVNALLLFIFSFSFFLAMFFTSSIILPQ